MTEEDLRIMVGIQTFSLLRLQPEGTKNCTSDSILIHRPSFIAAGRGDSLNYTSNVCRVQ
jgi:hypothetical protein